MSNAVKKQDQSPESYSPKKPFIIDLSAKGNALPSDTITDPYNGGEPPKASNRILNYRRIQNWENFFLCSAVCSMAKALGEDENVYNKEFFSAITGDMFAYLYSKEAPCDSGITNYFVVPQVIKKAYAAFGYDCIYISNEYIKSNFRIVMNAIKASVDAGVPVLAWGVGNVIMSNGSCYNPFPEGSLIGGYGENDILYINLYPGPERMTVDNDGYSEITNGLGTTNGLFFAGEKIEKTDLKNLYGDVIRNIPVFLTLTPADSNFSVNKGTYHFGKQAFDIWADVLTDDTLFENKTDDELNNICWNLHCSPFCMVCTSNASGYFKKITEQYPDMEKAGDLLVMFNKIKAYQDEIWAYHGGFFPPMDKFRTHEFRSHIAEILRKMGDTCTEILKICEV